MPVVNTTQNFATGDTVTSTSLNNIMDQSIFVAGAVVAGDGLTVTDGGQMTIDNLKVTGPKIGNLEVSTGKIANDAITTAKIADLNVTTGKIADLGVTTAKIADSNVTTTKIADANITAGKLNGAQTGTAPIFGCRAWVNFDGTTAANVGGSYTRTGTIVTCTINAHGLIVGHVVRLDFTGGTPTSALDGTYTVTEIVDLNTFKVTTVASGDSTGGTVSALRRQIRQSGNVSSVTYLNTPGQYAVNFTVPMQDANYAVSGFSNYTSSAVAGLVGGNATSASTAASCDVYVANSTTGTELNTSRINVMVIR